MKRTEIEIISNCGDNIYAEQVRDYFNKSLTSLLQECNSYNSDVVDNLITFEVELKTLPLLALDKVLNITHLKIRMHDDHRSFYRWYKLNNQEIHKFFKDFVKEALNFSEAIEGTDMMRFLDKESLDEYEMSIEIEVKTHLEDIFKCLEFFPPDKWLAVLELVT